MCSFSSRPLSQACVQYSAYSLQSWRAAHAMPSTVCASVTSSSSFPPFPHRRLLSSLTPAPLPSPPLALQQEALAAHLVGVCGDGQAIAPALREHLQTVAGPSVGVGPMVAAVAGSIQKALDGRQAEIDTLQFEVVRVVSEYNRLQRTLHAKLAELALPEDGVPPLDILPMPSFDASGAASSAMEVAPPTMGAHSTARVSFDTFRGYVDDSPWQRQ